MNHWTFASITVVVLYLAISGVSLTITANVAAIIGIVATFGIVLWFIDRRLSKLNCKEKDDQRC